MCVHVCVCVCMCVHVCVCVCMCVYVCVKSCVQVKVSLHNVYWYTCIRVCEPSIITYSVCADHCVGKESHSQPVQLSWKS